MPDARLGEAFAARLPAGGVNRADDRKFRGGRRTYAMPPACFVTSSSEQRSKHGGGALYTYGNNSVNGNTTNGAFTGTAGLQ
jgi:hypothetical protein